MWPREKNRGMTRKPLSARVRSLTCNKKAWRFFEKYLTKKKTGTYLAWPRLLYKNVLRSVFIMSLN